MNDITHIPQIRVDLFTISQGGNRNKQGGASLAFSSVSLVLWCGFVVLWRNPLGLKKTKVEI